MPYTKPISFSFFMTLFCLQLFAQQEPIGQWRSHLPYRNVISTATNGSKLFVGGKSSFFTYDLLGKEISTYSKVNGMSDVSLKYVAHDLLNETSILAYENSNIDLFKNETFYNIPDLKLRATTSDKSIYDIITDNGFAYLSTGLGIVVLNLTKREIKETYVFTKDKKNYPVKGLSATPQYFYAATDNGLYRSLKTNPNIQASASWTLIDSTRLYSLSATAANKTFVATKDSVFVIQNDTAAYIFSIDSTNIRHLDPIENGLAITTYNTYKGVGKVFSINDMYARVDSSGFGNPMQATQTSDKAIWIADIDFGLRTKDEIIVPNGPYDVGAYDIIAENGKVYVAHGSYDDRWNIAVNPNGISIFENNEWKSYNRFTYSAFNNLTDAVRLAKDPTDNTLYIASQTDGMYFLKPDGTSGHYREDVFDLNLIDPSSCRLSGVAFDQQNNLWVSQTNSAHELVARSAQDGNWYKFSLPATRPRVYWENGAAGLIVDDYNQKWFFSPAGGGVLVYDDKNTLENQADDEYTRLVSGKGAGNLPDNLIQCIVNDKKGVIWIGTNNGIGIVNCPNRVISRECEAEIRVVQYDQFAGELFAGENVKSIAVDGANRKWIGTGNGVWLISEDANKVIYRFTTENSPLPSNIIQTIKVDGTTGDVYIGTDKGLVSFRSTATDGGKTNNEVVIFPNPVQSNYKGSIAIKGLVDNADVRITDISGQLIYRSKALGGQAIWNGMDYTGRRPQTGVFLVFVSNNTGTEKFVGKMVFIK